MNILLVMSERAHEQAALTTIERERSQTVLLNEIEKHVMPLSRAEKWQLIKDVQEMLWQEEVSRLQYLSQPGLQYPLFTPVGLEEGAMTLQGYLDEGKL